MSFDVQKLKEDRQKIPSEAIWKVKNKNVVKVAFLGEKVSAAVSTSKSDFSQDWNLDKESKQKLDNFISDILKQNPKKITIIFYNFKQGEQEEINIVLDYFSKKLKNKGSFVMEKNGQSYNITFVDNNDKKSISEVIINVEKSNNHLIITKEQKIPPNVIPIKVEQTEDSQQKPQVQEEKKPPKMKEENNQIPSWAIPKKIEESSKENEQTSGAIPGPSYFTKEETQKIKKALISINQERERLIGKNAKVPEEVVFSIIFEIRQKGVLDLALRETDLGYPIGGLKNILDMLKAAGLIQDIDFIGQLAFTNNLNQTIVEIYTKFLYDQLDKILTDANVPENKRKELINNFIKEGRITQQNAGEYFNSIINSFLVGNVTLVLVPDNFGNYYFTTTKKIVEEKKEETKKEEFTVKNKEETKKEKSEQKIEAKESTKKERATTKKSEEEKFTQKQQASEFREKEFKNYQEANIPTSFDELKNILSQLKKGEEISFPFDDFMNFILNNQLLDKLDAFLDRESIRLLISDQKEKKIIFKRE